MRRYCVSFFVLVIVLAMTGLCAAREGADHVCFRQIDADQDGKVTFQEFAKHYGQDEKKFKAVDTDGDGQLTHDEYHDFLGHGADEG